MDTFDWRPPKTKFLKWEKIVRGRVWLITAVSLRKSLLQEKIRAKLVQEIVNDFPTGQINQPFLFKSKRPKVNFFLDFSFKINFIISTLYWVIKWLTLKGKGEKISYYIIWCIKEEIAFQNWDLNLEMILHTKNLYRPTIVC